MSDADAGEPALNEVLREAATRLAVAGVPDPSVDAELLAAHVLGIGRGELAAASVRGDRMPHTAVIRMPPGSAPARAVPPASPTRPPPVWACGW